MTLVSKAPFTAWVPLPDGDPDLHVLAVAAGAGHQAAQSAGFKVTDLTSVRQTHVSMPLNGHVADMRECAADDDHAQPMLVMEFTHR